LIDYLFIVCPSSIYINIHSELIAVHIEGVHDNSSLVVDIVTSVCLLPVFSMFRDAPSLAIP